VDNELEKLVQLVLWGVCIVAALVLGAQFVRGWKSAMAERRAGSETSNTLSSPDRDTNR
jgi:hypothetical protein